MKKMLYTLAAVMISASLFAEEKTPGKNVPAVGSTSIGITFNVATLANNLSMQPKAGDFAGSYVEKLAGTSHQMFILSMDPLATFRVKHRMTEHMNFRAAFGFNGSTVNYAEYVDDDLAKAINPASEKQVADQVRSNLNSTNFAVGIEYTAGKGNLKFVAGANILYAFAGGKVDCSYGNAMTNQNIKPTQMKMTSMLEPTPVVPGVETPKQNSFNQWQEWQGHQGISYARPVECYNVGFNHGLGFQVDMGIEWFFIEHLSLGASATFTPVMFVFQPQTYTVYEGFSTISNQVENYNALVSPGSWACLYGTQNLGLQLSLNYYF